MIESRATGSTLKIDTSWLSTPNHSASVRRSRAEFSRLRTRRCYLNGSMCPSLPLLFLTCREKSK
jgi:hypothetical protein